MNSVAWQYLAASQSLRGKGSGAPYSNTNVSPRWATTYFNKNTECSFLRTANATHYLSSTKLLMINTSHFEETCVTCKKVKWGSWGSWINRTQPTLRIARLECLELSSHKLPHEVISNITNNREHKMTKPIVFPFSNFNIHFVEWCSHRTGVRWRQVIMSVRRMDARLNYARIAIIHSLSHSLTHSLSL